MKWEILFALLFVVFPLLQSLLGRGAGPPAADAEEEEEHDDFAAAPPLPAPAQAEPFADEEDHVPGLLARGERPAPEPEELHGPPVVSLEPLAPRPAPLRAAFDLEPSRTAEHARFHLRTAQAAVEPRPPEHRLRLRGPGELRRAVLLGEVLGPPRSLRTLEDDER